MYMYPIVVHLWEISVSIVAGRVSIFDRSVLILVDSSLPLVSLGFSQGAWSKKSFQGVDFGQSDRLKFDMQRGINETVFCF